MLLLGAVVLPSARQDVRSHCFILSVSSKFALLNSHFRLYYYPFTYLFVTVTEVFCFQQYKLRLLNSFSPQQGMNAQAPSCTLERVFLFSVFYRPCTSALFCLHQAVIAKTCRSLGALLRVRQHSFFFPVLTDPTCAVMQTKLISCV